MKDILFNIKSNFSFFTLFSSQYGSNFSFYMHFEMSSAICFNLDQFKILSSGYGLTLYHTIPTFNDPKEEAFGKHCGKRRNDGNQHFLLFPKTISIFDSHLFYRLKMLSTWSSINKNIFVS